MQTTQAGAAFDWPARPWLPDMETDISKRLLCTAHSPAFRASQPFKGKALHKGESSRSGKDVDFKCFLFYFGSREFCWCRGWSEASL